jgi:hypothetical protein
MRVWAVLAIAATVGSLGASSSPASLPASFSTGSPATPVIVELFTSEGCSSCPPADTLLQKLLETQPVPGAVIIGLGQHVDYWDQLGWKDRFSSAALTDRQRLYAARLAHGNVYTPQMVVDGTAELVGSDANAARRALQRAAAAPHGRVRLTVQAPDREQLQVAVTVAADYLPARGAGDHPDVVVAVTEDYLRSDVKRGENHGRVLSHAAVVRQLVAIGEAPGERSTRIQLAPDWQRDQLKIVAFVQERRSRAILGSAVAPLAAR